MTSLLQVPLLFLCWLAALATLLIFLETWFALSGRHRFLARRASGAYGVVSVFVPMRGPAARVEQTIRSIFGQSYPFIELILVYPEEQRQFAALGKQFRSARSHIPVRLVPALFPIDSSHDRIRALEHALPGARGRWFVVIEPGVVLDRFAVETGLEFAGSNEISALALDPGIRCRTLAGGIVAPSMEQALQIVRIVTRRRGRVKTTETDPAFAVFNREAFDVVNRVNRIPGILNDAPWSLWGYQVEGLRTFSADGSKWIWREAGVRSWCADTEPERRYSRRSIGFVAAGILVASIAPIGLAFAFFEGIRSFSNASIFAFSAAGYALMAVSYLLFARRLRAAVWFAPFWPLSHIPAAVMTLAEMRRLSRLHTESREPIRKAHTFL